MKKETAYRKLTDRILANLDHVISWQKAWDANRHPMNGLTGAITSI